MKEAVYQIVSRCSNKALARTDHVVSPPSYPPVTPNWIIRQVTISNDPIQFWTVAPAASWGTYYIHPYNDTSRSLSPVFSITVPNPTSAQLAILPTNDAYVWRIIRIAPYFFALEAGGFAMDVPGGSGDENQIIQVYHDRHHNDNQQWVFLPVFDILFQDDLLPENWTT